MAFPNPEGSGSFLHTALRNDSFDPANPQDFYSHMLLEIVVDKRWHNAYYDTRIGEESHHHLRTPYEYLWPTDRNSPKRFRYMPVMYGPDCGKIERYWHWGTTKNYRSMHTTSNHTDVYLLPVPLPTPKERKVWVDLTYPLRAIYIPKAHMAGPRVHDRCSYYVLSMRQRDLSLDCGPGKVEFPRNNEDGWGYYHPQCTASFDIQMIAHLLAIPREYVADKYQNVYQFVTIVNQQDVLLFTNYEVQSSMPRKPENPSDMIQLGTSLTYAVSRSWGVRSVPAQRNDGWLVKVLRGIVDICERGCIPAVDPLLALGTQVFMQALMDPSHFSEQKRLTGQIPPYMDDTPSVQIPRFLNAITDSMHIMRRLIKPGLLQDMGKLLGMHYTAVCRTLGSPGTWSGGTIASIEPVPTKLQVRVNGAIKGTVDSTRISTMNHSRYCPIYDGSPKGGLNYNDFPPREESKGMFEQSGMKDTFILWEWLDITSLDDAFYDQVEKKGLTRAVPVDDQATDFAIGDWRSVAGLDGMYNRNNGSEWGWESRDNMDRIYDDDNGYYDGQGYYHNNYSGPGGRGYYGQDQNYGGFQGHNNPGYPRSNSGSLDRYGPDRNYGGSQGHNNQGYPRSNSGSLDRYGPDRNYGGSQGYNTPRSFDRPSSSIVQEFSRLSYSEKVDCIRSLSDAERRTLGMLALGI